MVEVNKAEVLEQMCLLVTARHTIHPASEVGEPEKHILRYKSVGGRNYFPISNTATDEGIKSWLSDPFIRTLIGSVSVDCTTMEGILRKVFGDSYDRYYQFAETKASNLHKGSRQ